MIRSWFHFLAAFPPEGGITIAFQLPNIFDPDYFADISIIAMSA
jgi:hypothetical protein